MEKISVDINYDDDSDVLSQSIVPGSLFRQHQKQNSKPLKKPLSETPVESFTLSSAATSVTVTTVKTSSNIQNTVSCSAITKEQVSTAFSVCQQDQQPACSSAPQAIPTSKTSIIVSNRQRGNPLLKSVRNVPYEFGEIIPDYQLGKASCALFLSLRYHQLKPDYIHTRLRQLGKLYDLRILLVQVDVKDPHHCLKELAEICVLSDCTLILAFSPEEAGRYLETYKAYEHKPPDLIMERTDRHPFTQFTDCITSVKKLNKTDASTLLSTFTSFSGICDATEDDLSRCTGFGPQKAKRLYSVLREPFLTAKKIKPAARSNTTARQVDKPTSSMTVNKEQS